MTLNRVMDRHCERSEAIHTGINIVDCFVALRAPRNDGFRAELGTITS